MICTKLKDCIDDKIEKCIGEEACIAFTDERTSVRCEQKKKVYRLNNDCGAKIRKYEVDGGVVQSEQGMKACDNLIVVYSGDINKLVFVELKGTDIRHAVEQLKQTISYYACMWQGEKVYARIVHTQGVPGIRNDGRLIELERLVRSRGGNLKMGERSMDETLSRLDERE